MTLPDLAAQLATLPSTWPPRVTLHGREAITRIVEAGGAVRDSWPRVVEGKVERVTRAEMVIGRVTFEAIVSEPVPA